MTVLALGSAGEVPTGEVEARDEVDRVPTAEQQRPFRGDAADRAGPQRIQERLREPQVRDRSHDAAVLNQPDAVPGEPGHDLRLRVEDPRVPEVGHEDAALDAGDELVSRLAARLDDEVRPQRT